MKGSNTIENCIVEGFKCDDISNGIVGSFDESIDGAIVRNCLINNSNVSAGIFGSCFADALGLILPTPTVKTCVVDRDVNFFRDSKMEDLAEGCVNSTEDDRSVLNISSISGESGTTWYYAAEDYNDGFPYLRQFLDWQTINFVAGEGGSVSQSSMEIPSDAEPSKVSRLNNTTDREPTYFAYWFYASPNANYDFTKWTWDSSTKTYTANFELKKIKVTFTNAENTNVNTTTEIEVYASRYITYAVGKRNKNWYSVTFKVYDVNNQEHKIEYLISDNKYVIFGVMFNGSNKSSPYQVFEDVNITVNVVLKTYNIEFK